MIATAITLSIVWLGWLVAYEIQQASIRITKAINPNYDEDEDE